ncbi:MAG TPA: electron transfer flavoprotein subunit beta/FixA family protein [Chloroflexota bacterium]|nr:electron transfer flavoprotein subunit beta/FixA family protein [Chloroflexota bacterium]
MNVVVLIKQVLDPELPARSFRVNRELKTPEIARAPQVMSIFDGNALEIALKLKETAGAGAKVTALSLGEKSAEDVLRKALAVTADEAVLLIDPGFSGLDSFGKARVLAAGVREIGQVDLVIAGRQAADWEAGQVGSLVAEELGWPCVAFVSRISLDGDALKLRRELEDGYQTIRTNGPTVVTATNDESNVLRFAKVRDVMASSRKPIANWNAAKLRIDVASLRDSATEVLDLFVPEGTRHAEMIEGDSPSDKARALARRLRELSVL